jgi:hypothetical protein
LLYGLLVADHRRLAHEGSLLSVRDGYFRGDDDFRILTVRPQQAPTARKLSTHRQIGGEDGATAIGGSGSIAESFVVCDVRFLDPVSLVLWHVCDVLFQGSVVDVF